MCENKVLFKTKTSKRLLPQWQLNFLVLLYSKDICISLVDQINCNVSKTCLRVVIHEALLPYNLLVLFSAKLFDRRRRRMNYNSATTWQCQVDSFQKSVYCSTNITCMCRVARIFIDSGRLHIKRTVPKGTVRLVRLVRKFKQRTNVPYPYHSKKHVPYKCKVLLKKNCGVPYRVYVPYRTAILGQKHA